MKFEKLEIKIRHSLGARILVILRENNFLPQIWEGPELFIKNLWLTWAQCFTLHFLSLANISNVVLEKEPKMIKMKVLFKSTLPYLYPFICTPNPPGTYPKMICWPSLHTFLYKRLIFWVNNKGFFELCHIMKHMSNHQPILKHCNYLKITISKLLHSTLNTR